MDNFIGNNINAIRVDKGLNQEQLAKIADVSQTTISAWECGTSTPRKRNVEKLSFALGITYDDVMSEENGYAVRALSRPRLEDASVSNIEVPVYGSVAAGLPLEMEEIASSFPVPFRIMSKHPRAFLLKVEGDSMNRTLPNGCYALVDPDEREADEKAAFAVCVGDRAATIKRVKRIANGFELIPDSTDPGYEPIVYDYLDDGCETVSLIGRVVWMTAPFDYEI